MNVWLVQRLRRGRDQEDGAILILVLIIVIGVVLILAAVLSFAQSGLNTSFGYRTSRNVSYYTDGTMDGAINAIRNSSTMGAVGVACPTFTPTSPSSTTSYWGANGHTYSVSCQPLPGSGAIPPNQPRYAIQTLASVGGASLTIDKNNTLNVDGSIYSNGPIVGHSGGPSLEDTGTVTAVGACSSGVTVTATGGTSCLASNPASADPGYAAAVDTSKSPNSVLAAVDPTPTCAGANAVFPPGLYTEVPKAPSGCSGGVWWFQPGVDYFDFQTGSTNWSVSNSVVGGTLAGLLTASTLSSGSFPGACDKTAAAGVQFIFGGASTISAPTGGSHNLELCASTSATSQEIVLYGPAGLPARSSTVTDLVPSTASSTSIPPFVPAGGALTLKQALADDNDADPDATAVLAASKTATLQTGSYTTIPAGSLVTKLVLRIAHLESSSTITPKATVTLGGTALPTTTLTKCTSACEQDIDLTSSLPADFAYQALDSDTTNPVSVSYSAQTTSSGAGTESLGWMDLQVTYAPPAFESTTCLATNPCNLIEDGSPGGGGAPHLTLLFHGTVYAPSSGLKVVLQTAGLTVFDRGVIAGTLFADVSSSSQQTVAPFALPEATASRSVLFTASVDGTPELRAVATYQDFQPNPNFPNNQVAFPGYSVAITDWSVLRCPTGGSC